VAAIVTRADARASDADQGTSRTAFV